MPYNISNHNKTNTKNYNTKNYLELKITDILKNIFKELFILSIFYYFSLTFLFIFLYQIFSYFFLKQENSYNQLFVKKTGTSISNYLSIFNIPLHYQYFSSSLFNFNFMVLSFVYSNNFNINLVLTKRDIYSYEITSKMYTLNLDGYKIDYTNLNLNNLALIDLFINANDSSKNRAFNLIFDSNLIFFKSYEFEFNNMDYKMSKVIYNNGFYYILFTFFNSDNLEYNNKIILLKMDSNQKIYDVKLIKLPYKIESLDFYYPFIFFNVSHGDQNKVLLLKIEDKNYLEFSAFLLEHNYLRIELLNAINFKDDYLLIFKFFNDSFNSELIFVNLNNKLKIEKIVKFSSNIINIIKIEKVVALDNSLYFIYRLVNDEKALGIIKVNILNYSCFNKVIFTKEERSIKFLDATNLFKNLLLFWDYTKNDISVLSLDLSNESKINNDINPIFITDFDYYLQNKFVFNFNSDNKDVKMKFLLQKNLVIYTNIDKNYFNLEVVDSNISDIKDLKINNKEINFF